MEYFNRKGSFVCVRDKKNGHCRRGSVPPVGMKAEASRIEIADIHETGRLQQGPGIFGPQAFIERKPFLNPGITAKNAWTAWQY